MTEVRQFDQHELSVDLVLLDEGYQSEIGDWLTPRDDFGSTVRLAADIRSGGRRAGIWVAPFLVGSKSETARLHPEWLVPGITAGTNWGQEQLVLDVTHPGAARHLHDVFTELCRQGYDHFKLDFVYAGAIEGRRHEQLDGIAAYRARHATPARSGRPEPDPARLRRTDPAQHRPGRLHAGLPGHRSAGRPAVRRHQPARPARRPVDLGRAGVPARPLVGQRLRLPDRATRRPGPRSVGRPHRERPRPADVQRPDRRPGRVGPRPHPGVADAELGAAASAARIPMLKPRPAQTAARQRTAAGAGRLRPARTEHDRCPRLPARAGADRHRAQPVRLEAARHSRVHRTRQLPRAASATATSGTRCWSPCTTC